MVKERTGEKGAGWCIGGWEKRGQEKRGQDGV